MDCLKPASVLTWDAEQVVEKALTLGAQGVGFSYSEPVAALEFVLKIMHLAQGAGLFTVWHTNGYLSSEAVEVVGGCLDAVCLDLKASDDRTYRRLTGGRLGPILAAARSLAQAGVWMEVCTPLLVGVNASERSVRRLAQLILETLGAKTPWHLMRGIPAWQMANIPVTSDETLERAASIGREVGLAHVYVIGWGLK